MGLQVVALGCLIGAIVLGFVKKTNVGLVCFGLALILGKQAERLMNSSLPAALVPAYSGKEKTATLIKKIKKH